MDKVRLGISGCLLGWKVRYDGRDKHEAFPSGELADWIEWVPVCPEVGCGLSVPRPPMHLERGRLIVTASGEDLTDRMADFCQRECDRLAPLDLQGFVLKNKSPSCAVGTGLFALALRRRFPAWLLIGEDEVEALRKWLQQYLRVPDVTP